MDLLSPFRKSLAGVTLTALMASFVVAPAAYANVEDFTDADEIPSWAEEAIDELMDQGVIAGNDDGSFAPNRQLNRAEVSKIIVLATGVDFDTTGGPHFPDVQPSEWFYDYIETMYNYGWINGYPDGFFRPAVGINRAEIAKMVVNAFEIEPDLSGAPHFGDVGASDWFYSYVETAYNNGLMQGYGDGTFGPGNAVTRAETTKVVYDSQLLVSQPVGPAEGTLEVMLSNETPRGTNIPYNSTSVPYTTLEFTASDDSDVEISSITVTRLGLGDNDDFQNVWMEIDGFKVGNDRSINNDDVVELRFNPPVVVPAGQTIVADVVGSAKFTDSNNNVGHFNRLAVVTPDDIVSTAANVVGDFPIEGEEMEIASYEVTELDFSILGSDTTVDVGDNFIEVGKFRMLNSSNTNKDVELRAITYKNDGTAELEDTLENVALYVSGEQISAETIIDGDYVTFRLDNGITGGYVLEDGDSQIFSIRADIVSAERGDTIEFKVDNFEDIVGVEIGTAFGVRSVYSSGADSSSSCATGDEAEDDCARLRTYTVDSGDLNISRDPSSPGNQEYSPGTNDVVILTARLVVDQPLIVDGVTIDVATGTQVVDDTPTTTEFASTTNVANLTIITNELNDQFDNFRFFLNDRLIDSENDFVENSSGSNSTGGDIELQFDTTFEVAGTSILKIVGNIQDAANTNTKLKLEVQNGAFDSPEYISTGDQVQTSKVLGSAQGSFVEVQVSEIQVTRTDGFSDDDKIVAGVDDVTFMKFVMDNNDAGDVKATAVTVQGVASGKSRTLSNFTLAIFADGTQQGSAKNFTTDDDSGTTTAEGNATFNDLDVLIPSSGQKEFTVVVDTIEASAEDVVENSAIIGTNGGGDYVEIADVSVSEFTVGDTVDVIVSTAESAAATAVGGTITTTEFTVDVVDTTNDEIELSGTPTLNDTAVAVAGDTEVTFGDAGAQGETIIITDPASSEVICTVTLDIAGAGDSGDCSDGTATISNAGAYADADAVAADFIAVVTALPGYTVQAGATADDVDFVETAAPFVEGNVTIGGTYNIAATANTVAGVATVDSDVSLKDALQIEVVDVDADNVENGQEVTVLNSTTGVAIDTTANAVSGATFELVDSGTLTVSLDSTVFSDIIVANSTNVDVLKLRFNAADDEVQVKDIYLVNDLNGDGDASDTVGGVAETDIGDRVDFKLFNSSGQLIQQKQMTNGIVQFELNNNDRIRVPKDNSTFVTVKADVRDITKANQTGKRMKLVLDSEDANGGTNYGIEAITAATGDDIEVTEAGDWGTAAGQEFVAYRSNISVTHAASGQPTINDPQSGSQEMYRFSVTADQIRQVELGRLSFDFSTQGMESSNTSDDYESDDFTVRQVKSDGTVDSTSSVATVTVGTGVVTADESQARLHIDFTNQKLSQGETRTYAIFVADTENTAGGDSDDDSVSFTILRDTDYSAPATLANQRVSTTATAGLLVWSDESDPSHSTTTSDWLNGYLVDIDTTSYIASDPN